jgi:hypothetical protein
MWKKLAVHKWVSGCKITESLNTETEQRRFTATIDGWQNWRIMTVDQTSPQVAEEVIRRVTAIKAAMDDGDAKVFDQGDLSPYWCKR